MDAHLIVSVLTALTAVGSSILISVGVYRNRIEQLEKDVTRLEERLKASDHAMAVLNNQVVAMTAKSDYAEKTGGHIVPKEWRRM